ncbi:MAG: HlyC/CorC family transporter [Gammaproteobacteria bacterium]|nr:HlyC/CorC family transporter [Gammaproteobacteria bacterium]
MSDIPLGVLFGALIFLVLLSAFFSASEIAMVSLNRHRLRHLAASGHLGAKIAQRLLARPDRLIGTILLGSNAVNALFSALTTVLVIRVWGSEESSIAIATAIILLVVLIFTDLAPKTLAALHPERIAFPSAFILRPLLWIIYPFVWAINGIANGILRLMGVDVRARPVEQVSPEELKAIILEAKVLIPEAHQDMLLAILELEKITVEDVMIPRGRIEGINLDAEWDDVVEQLKASHHTRLPVYRGSLDNVIGMTHLRKVLNLMRDGRLDQESFQQALVEPYFVPQDTSLHKQLLNFKQARRRVGLVVDEYGDIQGFVTMNDILEEIVGDFSIGAVGKPEEVQPQEDGTYLVRGSVSLRDLNRRLGWQFPTEESRTLNGLILEYLEDIPEPGTSLMLNGYMVEIIRIRGTTVDVARIRPMSATATSSSEQPTT